MDEPRDRTEPETVELFPNGEVAVRWRDGHESFYPGKYLRCHCRCAACVDEETGVRILREDSVPDDVHARATAPVGRYGLQILWSDGHSTGIYAHALLRGLCPCEDCRLQTEPRETPPGEP